jgi:hypothetical protein
LGGAQAGCKELSRMHERAGGFGAAAVSTAAAAVVSKLPIVN